MNGETELVAVGAGLYEQDFCLWLEQTAKLLQSGRFSEVDVANLVDEIKAIGRSERRAVESILEVILMHLLKYRYQPERRSRSWLLTLFEHRKRMERLFKDSPSLRRYFEEVFGECYQNARQMATIETGLELEVFPVESPFGIEEVLAVDFLPLSEGEVASNE
ncbi:MAG TPA: DUF29 domain-containing protein [Cyanobacteria bacterium UBA8803]|nr:DUF29 domain-containing protein [Cyanobacteria bacterium UBA9273]HBL57035.1 DUF29 domain-containing protein [Cyanobacteria bacterium UBA8803]